MYRIKKMLHSIGPGFLAVMIICGMMLPHVSVTTVLADTDSVLAWGSDWHYYCIDGSGYAPNTASTKNDRYMRVDAREGLNTEERAVLFWSMLSFMASYRHDGAAAGKIAAINQGAQASGLRPIGKGVSEEDLKGVIHSAKVRSKYEWLDYAAAHGEQYLRLAGLLSGSAQTNSGKGIPALLQNATSLESAVYARAAEGGYVLEFDPSGRDGDFLEKVPVKMSADGTSWSSGSVNGWTLEKSRTQVRVTNPDPQALPVYIMFDPSGTDYALSSGGFGSPDECYSSTLQVWKCVECAGTHATGGKIHPLENHQRTIWMELADMPSGRYYGALGNVKQEAAGNVDFRIYRHEESMDGDYLVQLYKYDHETGQPLKGAVFDLYERFDDKERMNRENRGVGEIYTDSMGHSPVFWDGFRLVTSVCTDESGHASYKLEKQYYYDKTFCDGHPAPAFGAAPEDGGENGDGDENEDSYGAKVYTDEEEYEEDDGGVSGAGSAELARQWLACVEACEARAEDGTHFHWIMDAVDADAIETVASSGEIADCGSCESADAETAYERSGCKEDCEATYKAFISMRYSYTFVEKKARDGYVLHGLHREDVPIEIITTDASQNGANGVFGGGYSNNMKGGAKTEPRAGKRETGGTAAEEDSEPKPGREGNEIRTRKTTTVRKAIVKYEDFIWGDEPVQKADMTEDGFREEAPIVLDDGTPSDAAREEEHTTDWTASPSDAEHRKETNDETYREEIRTAEADAFTFSRADLYQAAAEGGEGRDGSSLFDSAYAQALNSASKGSQVEKGPSDLYSHGGGVDGAEEAWRIYDHRTEGELHINKRDMALESQEKEGYSSYGDTQGDAALEGAVYGLFAAEDLIHPDGTTGVVFRQNDLVSIAAVDKEGDASFLAITEAPGYTYDYRKGSLTPVQGGWNLKAPDNLYVKTQEIDDYRADGKYVRSYRDLRTENGNCWIGRPLLMGNYYVKELSRSEGYELSVNGKGDPVSNRGYSLEVTIPRGEGSAAVTRAPYVELQSSGEEEDTMPNVINFEVTSQGTGSRGYDIALSLFPRGARLYRKDTSQVEEQVETVTGQKEKQYLFDAWGHPIYQRADADNMYPKQNPDGSFVTEEAPVIAVIPSMGAAQIKTLDETAASEILDSGPDGRNDRERNKKPLELNGSDDTRFLYVKMKVEAVLRACGFETPRQTDRESGQEEYSGRTKGVYDCGIRQGEPDYLGISGADAGSPAVKTVYGHPVADVEIPRLRPDGSLVTVGDAILSLLDFYGENPWYGFGGIHGYEETQDGWRFRLYAGAAGNPADFVVAGRTQQDHVIYHRIPWIPDTKEESPRWMYVRYGARLSEDVFGTYEDFRSWEILGQYRCSAVLINDAYALGDGTIRSKTVRQNVYYEKGETICGPDGSPLQAYEWVDVMSVTTQIRDVFTWTEIPVKSIGENLVGHSPGRYADAYGDVKNDKEESLYVWYKLVLPRREAVLTQKDIDRLPPDCGYTAGDTIGYGDYALRVLGAQIQVYLDYESQTITGDGVYVKPAGLVYPGQEYTYQDGAAKPGEGTRRKPIGVQERVITQNIKVTKSIKDPNFVKDGTADKTVENFRFKVYLKSNLERLYRDEEGRITWMDRKGREINPDAAISSHPGLVPKIYTKTLHKVSPLCKDPLDSVIANKSLYGMEKGYISGKQNEGYTAVLETKAGTYNYEKFFDAISVANGDKWRDASPSYTSYRPLGNAVNRSQAAEENRTVSDRVRQFAIDWYLDQEVEKLGKGGHVTYSDQLYDQALWEAVKKADNYLKPFFAYDLDRIYAVKWDSETDGGKDGDQTTLSADKREEGWCSGISASLPYGTYIVAEQQPRYAHLGDLKNRHYEIDHPREIAVPAVYEDFQGAVGTPQTMSGYYTYRRELTPEERAARYLIRFNQEDHVIRAGNHHGDFQVYKYGRAVGTISNGAAQTGAGHYFALTQDKYKPIQNYYNQEDDRSTGDVPYYLTEGMSGRKGISAVYRYSSVSETGSGAVMAGALKAHDGAYSQALVPWSLAAADSERKDMEPVQGGESSYRGSAYANFINIPYRSRLRIEKLDAQTHENLFHDGAIFRIYRAKRDESEYGTGETRTYEETTLITGSKEFLQGMGASQITSAARKSPGAGEIYTGFVAEGTPVCSEEDQVILTDVWGAKVGDFKAYTTTRDGIMENADGDGTVFGDQNAGYLETPQELDAGAYVLVEISPPAGYTRTRPVALEIYSDQIVYCKNGNSRAKILSTVYKRAWEMAEAGGGGKRNPADLARIYIENAPIKLRVEKRKNPDHQVTYKINGRVEGSLTEIGGSDALEYAYSQGGYLGYGWKKGTLEYLKQQKDAGAQVEIIYHDGVFAGYGYVTVSAQKETDENPYVAGAMMVLYEGLELKPSGDKEDYGFEGLVVERGSAGAVTRMYVKEGYAGTRIEFSDSREEARQKEGVPGVWDGIIVERSDTDILYYDLGDLDVFVKKRSGGKTVTYGYDIDHGLIELEQLEEDRNNIDRTDRENSVFAFKGGTPYLELTGGCFTEMSYGKEDKILTVPEGTDIYHLDREGNRDARVDPHTGMAYVEQKETGRIYVWPVIVTKDGSGRRIGTDKITTSRTATLNEHEENGYLTGSWKPEEKEDSHHMATVIQNAKGENMEGEAVFHENNGVFEKLLRPVIDEHGLPVYFSWSGREYERETWLYDRDGDPVRQKSSDLLENYQKASYLAENPESGDRSQNRIYHRYGESYLLENIWISGEVSPNDPFDRKMTEGQADILKRIPAGTYIMEELEAPEGYVKGLPVGITVEETERVQLSQMEDDSIKVLVRKLDDTAEYGYDILDMGRTDRQGSHPVIGNLREGKGSFGHGQIRGARLALFEAEKRGEKTVRKKEEAAVTWETGQEPLFVRELAAGTYLLEETGTPDGFVTADPVEVTVGSTSQVQIFEMYNDHTKVEFEKYTIDGKKKVPVEGAGFTLYEASVDANGQVIFDDGKPRYDKGKIIDSWKSSNGGIFRGFAEAFEEMYRDYGTSARSISWSGEGNDYRAEYVSHQQIDASAAGGESSLFPTSADIRFRTLEGQDIRIVVYEQQHTGQGRDYVFEYQFDYRRLTDINDYAAAYTTIEGIRRMDYLPAGKSYVLAETEPPRGYHAAADRLITVGDTIQVQRHGILNQESLLLVSKCWKTGQEDQEYTAELTGARLALYRADEKEELVREPEYLAAEWLSGMDGTYSEDDWINGRIPQGYKKGDKKPHELRQLPEGIYYLVELESPDYYTRIEPIRIVFSQNEQVQLVRAWDEPVKGSLEILKTDESGSLLQGAVFELTAYRGFERVPVFVRTVSDQDGKVKVEDLPVGEPDQDGNILPYRYRLREVTPPDGYASDLQIHTFWFEPDCQGETWEYGQKAEASVAVVNSRTKIFVGKEDFGSPDQWVEGAELAIYRTWGRDEQGNYMYDDQMPAALWTTGPEERHMVEGLAAGGTYILLEKSAPNGYEVMKPLIFTISADGRRICYVSGNMGNVVMYTREGSDAIDSVEIQGRYGVKVEMELRGEDKEVIASWTAGGGGHILRESDGIRDGEIYHITETTVYSDGAREITRRTTKRCHMTVEGTWTVEDRTVDRVQVKLSHEDGTEIRRWNPSEIMPGMVVENPAAPETPRIIVNGGKGAVKASDPVSTVIICTNTELKTADITLTVSPGQELTVIDPEAGDLRDGQIQYTLKQVAPGESRQVGFTSELSQDAKMVSIHAVSRCMGKSREEKKEIPVLQENRLILFNEVTGTGKKDAGRGDSDFRVQFYTDKGEEIKGRLEYEGSRSGTVASGGILRLSANEYVSVDPGAIYRNIGHRILDIQGERSVEGQTGAQGACAFFTREETDWADRAIFRKGCTYRISETTYYADGTTRESGKVRFSLDGKVSLAGVTAADRKQEVYVSKKDIAGQKELEGALMQVKKEDGTILEEWISGKEPHLLETVLEPGITYILYEKEAPEGYGYEEEIPFQVEKGECVNRIIMEDKKTHVVFGKKDLTGQEEIPGAKMQIRDEKGAVVDEWISGTTPHEVMGILEAGKTYSLHEETAPDGYGYASDVLFTVSMDGKPDKVEMRDAPTCAELSKTDITGGRELPGAKMEVLDQKGNRICQWISTEKPYKLTGVLKAGETYTLRETAPPDGYAWGTDVKFTVSKDGSVDRVIMKDEATRVEIVKTDSKTGEVLAGAALELLTLDGAVAEAWTSTGEAHVIEGKLCAGQTYMVRERRAPAGYGAMAQNIRFTVPKGAERIVVEVENGRKPYIPQIPEKPKAPEKTGKVYTNYQSVMTAHGGTMYQTFTNLGLPRTGNRGQSLLWTLCLAGAGICYMWATERLKRRRGLKEKFFVILCVCAALNMVRPVSAHAETVEVKPEGRLTVTGDVYGNEDELPDVPPGIYEYGEDVYVRRSYQVVEAMTEEGMKEVEETVIYEEVEQTDTLPETIQITVTDERYKTEYIREFPILDVQFYNWRWISGFELPITVEEADAETYELNGTEVPAQEDHPFAGYERELLSLAQINPDYYRILEVRWTGEAWLGEDGKVYRNGVATGEKYVADCRAVYGGQTVLPSAKGVAWQAMYEREEEETQTSAEMAENLAETWQLHVLETTGPSEDMDDEKKEGEAVWMRITLEEVLLSAGIFLLLLPILFIFIRRHQKSGKSLKKQDFLV